VSIVDVATNQIVGRQLLVFGSYADEKLKVLPANNTAFSVTLPTLAAGKCTQGGECVLQWFWFGTKAQQTYESCVDFVIVGAGGATGGNSTKGEGGSGGGVATTIVTKTATRSASKATGTAKVSNFTSAATSASATATGEAGAAAAPAPIASAPTPIPADLAPGAFGGSAGFILLPGAGSFGGVESFEADKRRRRSFSS
jgi:hypothetical protein